MHAWVYQIVMKQLTVIFLVLVRRFDLLLTHWQILPHEIGGKRKKKILNLLQSTGWLQLSGVLHWWSFRFFSRAACSTIRWLNTDSLARAEDSSSVARACRALSCQLMAILSNTEGPPPQVTFGNFWRDTRRDKVVSSGLRDRMQRGQRYYFLKPGWTLLLELQLGRRTQLLWSQSLQSSHWSINPLAVLRQMQNLTSSIRSTMLILARLAALRGMHGFQLLLLRSLKTIPGYDKHVTEESLQNVLKIPNLQG